MKINISQTHFTLSIREHLKDSIRPDTTLISIMLVNNEVGTVQPLYEIA